MEDLSELFHAVLCATLVHNNNIMPSHFTVTAMDVANIKKTTSAEYHIQVVVHDDSR